MRMMREVQIPTTVSDVKIANYYKNVTDIDLSILKILQGYLGRIWIYID